MDTVILNDRYRLVELLGSGGMATVYRGQDMLLQRRVAIKVLREQFASDPAFLARFRREAQAAANLDHPNIVTVYDVGQDGERHYIVMEYVAGRDLKTLIRREECLSVDRAVDIATQIAAGVGSAHEAEVIHCDIKPQNVLVTDDGRAKVTDFGIARALSESGLTESETVWGSPHYFAPEQASGEPPSPASDVYSIGIVMYEMLAGSLPFRAEKPTALALMHMRESPPPLAVRNAQVPPRLEQIVQKALFKEPTERFSSAGQLASVLKEYQERVDEATRWQPVVEPAPEEAKEEAAEVEGEADRLIWILGIVAFIAVVGLIPLWGLVYRAYSTSPSVLPTSTPPILATATSKTQTVTVPDVEGEPKEEAREAVERAGLLFVVKEERIEPDVEAGIVLEQTPAPDEQVAADTEITVIVSAPRRELEMPDVVDYPVETIREGLESDDLQIEVEEIWHTKKKGMVVEQEPEAGATIHAGDTVTLTVSTGADRPIPLEVNLADKILLKSAELHQRTFEPGETLAITLRWQAQQSLNTSYVVFVHLIDPENPYDPPVAQEDVEPSGSTKGWVPGMEIVDQHRLTIPHDQKDGLYQLRVGMYPQGRPGDRLQVVDEGETTAESDSILITEVTVEDY